MSNLSKIKPIEDWANNIINNAHDGDGLEYDVNDINKFNTIIEPVRNADSQASYGYFTPELYDPSADGFNKIIIYTLENEMDAEYNDALKFASKLTQYTKELEQVENWVRQPLSYQELKSLHKVIHDVIYELAKDNNTNEDIESWREDDRNLADRIFLALTYMLAWQKYSTCVMFIWTLARPVYYRLSETVAMALDDYDLRMLHSALKCVKQRVHHFDGLLYGFYEGVGNLSDEDDDIRLDDMADGESIDRLIQREYKRRDSDDEDDDDE